MLMLILVSTSNVPVTSDMFTDDAVEIYFSEEDHLWYAAINPAGDAHQLWHLRWTHPLWLDQHLGASCIDV